MARAHRHLYQRVPDLKALADDYVGEARFGASILTDDLGRLPRGSRVLEIGAGSMLLSCAVQAMGHQVTAVEPVGTGFSHMSRLRDAVLDLAGNDGCRPEVCDARAEDLGIDSAFDFAYSINTMEHVDDVAAVLERVHTALRPGGVHLFVCPNYAFPYEPHFGIPTCGTKDLTWTVFRRWILASRTVVDPEGTWASLNWITVPAVRTACHALGARVEFDRRVTYTFIRRAIADTSFQRRHGAIVRWLATGLSATRVLSLATLIPPGAQPAMWCRVVREV